MSNQSSVHLLLISNRSWRQLRIHLGAPLFKDLKCPEIKNHAAQHPKIVLGFQAPELGKKTFYLSLRGPKTVGGRKPNIGFQASETCMYVQTREEHSKTSKTRKQRTNNLGSWACWLLILGFVACKKGTLNPLHKPPRHDTVHCEPRLKCSSNWEFSNFELFK